MTIKQLSEYINKHMNNPIGVCVDSLEDMIHRFDHPEADGYVSAIVGDADVLLMRAYEAHNAAIDAEVATEVHLGDPILLEVARQCPCC